MICSNSKIIAKIVSKIPAKKNCKRKRMGCTLNTINKRINQSPSPQTTGRRWACTVGCDYPTFTKNGKGRSMGAL